MGLAWLDRSLTAAIGLPGVRPTAEACSTASPLASPSTSAWRSVATFFSCSSRSRIAARMTSLLDSKRPALSCRALVKCGAPWWALTCQSIANDGSHSVGQRVRAHLYLVDLRIGALAALAVEVGSRARGRP